MSDLNLYVWLGGAAYEGSYLFAVADSVKSAREAILSKNRKELGTDHQQHITDLLLEEDDYNEKGTVKEGIQNTQPRYILPLEMGNMFVLDHGTG